MSGHLSQTWVKGGQVWQARGGLRPPSPVLISHEAAHPLQVGPKNLALGCARSGASLGRTDARKSQGWLEPAVRMILFVIRPIPCLVVDFLTDQTCGLPGLRWLGARLHPATQVRTLFIIFFFF